MIKGFYAVASAMLANINRQQVIAHDVANLETPGFKQVLSSLDDFMNTPVSSLPNDTSVDRVRYLGTLGLGVESAPDTTDFSQGGIKSTGNTLDLAIQGDGFFRIRTPDGERYTRDGRFIRDAAGQMVTVDGYQVLSKSGQPIKIPDGELSISPTGDVIVDGQAVAQIGLAAFKDPAAELVRTENNTFLAPAAPTGAETGVIAQGYLEMSNANPSQLMAQMVEVARSYQAAQQMVQNQDELLGKTISSLGRIG